MAHMTLFDLILDIRFLAAVIIYFGYMAVTKKSARKVQKTQNQRLMEALNLDLRSICEHLIIIGQTGSGKTSLLRGLFAEILPQRVGVFFQTVKTDASQEYQQMCQAAGREYIVFKCGTTRFNPAEYVLRAPWGGIEVFADFLEQCDKLIARESSDKDGSYWRNARKMLLIHTIGVCHIAYRGKVNLQQISKVLASIPRSPDAVRLDNSQWTNSFCHQTLVLAVENCETDEEVRRVKEAHDYLTIETPGAGPKAIAATVQHISALVANFTRGDLFATTCCEESEPIIDTILAGGIVICDDPVLLGVKYQFMQLVLGLILTRQALTRTVTKDTPTVLLVADEYHKLSAPEIDVEICTLGRSMRLARITAIQSLSVLMTAMTEGIKAKHTAQSLIGNHNTKVFLQNTDPETCELFETLSGKEIRHMVGGGRSSAPQQGIDLLAVGSDFSPNFHSAYHPRKFGSALSRLKSGGVRHGNIVSGYVFQSGTEFRNGLPFIKLEFEQ
jgi:type IV secretory pathway TraG/TraD family ATPase VirD4